MKTRLRKISKRTLSTLLSLLIILSTIMVGTISASAGGWTTNSLSFRGKLNTSLMGATSGGDSENWNTIAMTSGGSNNDYYHLTSVVEGGKKVTFKFTDQWTQWLGAGSRSAGTYTGGSYVYYTGLTTSGDNCNFQTPSTADYYVCTIQCWTNYSNDWKCRVDMFPCDNATIHYYGGSGYNMLYGYKENSKGANSPTATTIASTNTLGTAHYNGTWGNQSTDSSASEGVTGHTKSWYTHDLPYSTMAGNKTDFQAIIRSSSAQRKTADVTISTLTNNSSEVWIYSESSSSVTVTYRKSLLNQLNNSDYIAAYNSGTNPGGYSSTSYSTYKTAYESAATTFSAYASTQAQIDTALSNLTSAYTGLVLTHTATVGTHTNGTLTVNGGASATVGEGDTYSIVATPNDGYKLTDISVNSSSIYSTEQTTATTVSRTMGNADETVTATFSPRTYTVSCTGSNVTYTTNPTTGTYGSTVSFTVTASDPYVVGDVTGSYVDKDGITQSLDLTSGGSGTYSFTQPAGNVTITSTAVRTPRSVTVTKDSHITSYIVNDITYSDTHTFTVSDGSTFTVSSVTYQTGYESNNASLTIASVTSNQTFALTSKKTDYTITKNPTSNGSYTVTKNGSQITTANYGDTVVITPSPSNGYSIATVKYNDGSDNVLTPSNGTYSFAMPAGNVSVTVTFSENLHTVTATSANATMGTVSPSSSSSVGISSSQTFSASSNTGYYFTNWTVTSGSVYVGETLYSVNSTIPSSTVTVTATQNAALRADFSAYSHSISYGGSNIAYHSANVTTGTTGQTVRVYVKANSGYSLNTPVATHNGSGITVTIDSTDTTYSGYTCYTFTVPTVNDSDTITVTTTPSAITPTINVNYQSSASASSNATSGSAQTSSRYSETITFSNASSYPSGTVFNIYDGAQSIYNSTAGGTASYTTTLAAGKHTLKITATLNGENINSATVTLTVNVVRTVTVKAPKAGSKITFSYTNEFGTTNETVTPALNNQSTVYVKDSTNATVSKCSSDPGTLGTVYVDGDASNATFSVTKDCTVTAKVKSAVQLRGNLPGTKWDNTAIKMEYSDETNWVTALVNITSTSTKYEFKIYDGKWYGYGTDSDGGEVINNCTDSTGLLFQSGDTYKNCGFIPSTTGNYTFKYNTSTHRVVVEVPKVEHTISYSGSNYHSATTNPTSAYYNDSTTISVVADTGYVIDSVTITDSSSNVITATNDGTNYTFTMPDSNVTVTVKAYKTCTINVTKGTGVKTVSASVTRPDGANTGTYAGTFTTFPQTVYVGSTVVYTVTYKNGYGYSSHSGASKTSDTSFNLTTVEGTNTFEINASKKNYTISVTAANGTYTITNQSGTPITTAQIGDIFYVDITANANYACTNISKNSGTGLSSEQAVITNDPSTGSSTLRKKYTMGYGNVSLTASFVQTRKITNASAEDNITTVIKYTNMDGTANQTLAEGESAFIRKSPAPVITVTPDTGYKFNITIKANSTDLETTNGVTSAHNYTYSDFNSGTNAVTITITATEDRETTWYLTGEFNGWARTESGNIRFEKRSGESATSTAYVSVPLSARTAYEFKLYNNYSGGAYYKGCSQHINNDVTNWIFNDNTPQSNCTINTTIDGDYVFKVDFSESEPKLSVIFPVQTITYNANTNITYHADYQPTTAKYTSDSVTSVGKANHTVTIKMKANAGYMVTAVSAAWDTDSTAVTVTKTNPDTSLATSEAYYTATFLMPRDNVTITVTTTAITKSVTTNLDNGANTYGKIVDENGTELNASALSVGDIVYIQATAPSSFYTVDNSGFTTTHGLHSINSNVPNTGLVYKKQYRIKASNSAQITSVVNFIHSTPTISGSTTHLQTGKSVSIADMNWFTITNATTVRYYLSTTNTTTTTGATAGTGANYDTFTVPSTPNTYYIIVEATNSTNPGLSAKTAKQAFAVEVDLASVRINVYLDMHGNSATTPKAEVVTSTENLTVRKDETNVNYDTSLTANTLGNTSIYKAESMKVPDDGNDVVLKVSSNGKYKLITIDYTTQIKPIADNVEGATCDVWVEAINDSKVETGGTKCSSKVADGYQRLYLMKPTSWGADWNDMYIHCWDEDDNSWKEYNSNPSEEYFSYIGTANNYHYYRIDIPSQYTNFLVKAVANSTIKAKTKDKAIGTSNCFKLKSGPDLEAVSTETVPEVSNYFNPYNINVSDGAQPIKPTFTGASIVLQSNSDSTVAQYDSATGTITPLKSGTATLTFRVYGSIGTFEYRDVSTVVTVHDASKIAQLNHMSFRTATSVIQIKDYNDNGNLVQPSDINSISTRLTGVQAGTAFNGAGIWTISADSKTATVKYAAANSSLGYPGIKLSAVISHTDRPRPQGTNERFGFDHWEVGDSGTPSNTYKDADADIQINGDKYYIVYVPYKYTDVTITYKYYLYNTTRNGKDYNFYDPEYAGNENSSNPNFAGSHIEKSYQKTVEYRGNELNIANYSSIDNSIDTKLKELIGRGVHDVSNEYYTYTKASDYSVTDTTQIGSYKLSLEVWLVQSPRTYKFYVKTDGPPTPVNATNVTYVSSGTNEHPIYYQSYVELTYANLTALGLTGLTSGGTYKWSAGDRPDSSTTYQALATGSTYKFRVTTDNMYIKVEDTNSSITPPKSVVTYSGNSIVKEGASTEKLYQDFYLVDLFDTDMETYSVDVLDTEGNVTGTTDRPFDEITFVGGGGIYFSVDPETDVPLMDGIKTQGIARLTEGEYVLDKDKVTQILLDSIKRGAEDPDEIKQKFGTVLNRTAYKIGNTSTGLVLRYLPFSTYDSTSDSYHKNTNIYRYSSAIGGYQYIYSLSMDNKPENRTKDIRFYSYYVYSYTDYRNSDSGEVVYKIAISDNYVKVPTYVKSLVENN